MVEQTEQAGSGDTLGHSGHLCHICSKCPACFQTLGEVEPAVPEAAGPTPAEWVHGTMWKESEKSARATKTKARLMIDRAPVEQPVPSECEGG